MSAKRQRNQPAIQVKNPQEMTPEEQQAYVLAVSAEVDKLLTRRGCMLEFQPGFAPVGNGTFTVGVAARIIVKPAPKAN